jgi:hypothetical protein
VRVLAGAAVVVATTTALGALLGDPPPAGPVVVGRAGFDAPDGALAVRVPEGFSVVSAGRRVSLLSRDARLRLVVSTPAAVVEPGVGPEPMPADPVGWLTAHRGLDVLSTGSSRTVRPLPAPSLVVRARTADFAVTRVPARVPVLGRFASLQLFCDEGVGVCGRVSTQVVVRATFVDVGTRRPVLVAAYWPRGTDDDPDHGAAPMPALLEAAYRLALDDVARRPAVGPAA